MGLLVNYWDKFINKVKTNNDKIFDIDFLIKINEYGRNKGVYKRTNKTLR